jgi:hypothetical protein
MSCFSAEATVGSNVGGVRKSDRVPEHKSQEQKHESRKKREETKNL